MSEVADQGWTMSGVGAGFQSQFWRSDGKVNITVKKLSIAYPRHDFKMSLKLWKNEGRFGDKDCGDRHYYMEEGLAVTPPGGGTWPNTPSGEYYFEIVYLEGDYVEASGTRR